jgi:hypothetical protein
MLTQYFSGDVMENNEIGGACSTYGEWRVINWVLVGKHEGKGPLGRPWCRWVDNIMMYVQQVGCGCMDWIELAQDRERWRALVNALVNLRVP